MHNTNVELIIKDFIYHNTFHLFLLRRVMTASKQDSPPLDCQRKQTALTSSKQSERSKRYIVLQYEIILLQSQSRLKRHKFNKCVSYRLLNLFYLS